jgi:hypothetical protein
MILFFSVLFLGGHWVIASTVLPPGSSGWGGYLANAVTAATFVLYTFASIAPPGKVNFTRDETMELMESGRKAMVCRTCNIVRPVRSKHCPTCGICVGKFDHHCECPPARFLSASLFLRLRVWLPVDSLPVV